MDFKDTFFSRNLSINCKGSLVDFSTPKVMAIVNLTPDSFYDGGRYSKLDKLAERIDTVIKEGADIIDIGGFSSRPGAKYIDAKEEIKRLRPALELIRGKDSGISVSVDTFRREVAELLNTEFGIEVINDITAGDGDPELVEFAVEQSIPYIIMHMQGTPETMQENPEYEDVVNDLLGYFDRKIVELQSKGLKDIIIDPGFGFGKSMDNNYEILASLEVFQAFEIPLMVGLSRKSMIYNFLETTSDNALNGTTALHMYALHKGVNILRAHDVKEARQTISLHNKLNEIEKQA
ncbi:MAG: dihydropteroate synthase [Bacteroidales bacterium]|nr:dihydropteroate synthase [Bacteroidales bacterium]